MITILRRFVPFSRDAMPYRTGFRWTSVLLLATLGGCNGLHPSDQSRRPEDNRHESRGVLRLALHQFENDFREIAVATSKRVLREPMSEEHRQLVETWRSRIIHECNTAIIRDNPEQGLLDVWMLCRRARDYFQSGETVAVLGEESQLIVLDAAERTHNGIERIARDYLTEEGFRRMSQMVAEYADRKPISGTFADEPSFSVTDPGKDFLSDVWDFVTVPLRPFDELLRVVGSLPDMQRTVARFSDVIDEFPRKARKAGEVLLDRVDKSHPKLHSTVVEVRQTAEVIERTLAGVPEAAGALKAAAEAIARAKKEIGTLWSTPDGRGESASSPSKEPFNFQEVTDSAKAVTQMVAELRGLMQEVRDMSETKPLSAGMDAFETRFDRIGKEMKGVLTHAGKWGVLLMALLFVLLLLYRAVTNRSRAAHPSP